MDFQLWRGGGVTASNTNSTYTAQSAHPYINRIVSILINHRNTNKSTMTWGCKSWVYTEQQPV